MTNPSHSQPPPSISPTELLQAQAAPSSRLNARALLPSLLVNGAAPYFLYQTLTGNGLSTAQALTDSAIFPVIGIGLGFARTRRVDVIGAVSLVFIVVGVASSLVSGDPRFILIKESLITGVFGVVCLASLLLPRPVMFYFGRQFSSGGDPARAAAFDAMWQYPHFRAVNRNITIAWGVAFVLEAALRVALSFVLPIPTFLLVSPILAVGVTVGMITWTFGYARRSAKLGAERLARLAAPPTA